MLREVVKKFGDKQRSLLRYPLLQAQAATALVVRLHKMTQWWMAMTTVVYGGDLEHPMNGSHPHARACHEGNGLGIERLTRRLTLEGAQRSQGY